MIDVNKKDIQNYGGLLNTIRSKSSLYLRDIMLNNKAIKGSPVDIQKLDRTIVHAHPHLDEYFADLLFRSALPPTKMGVKFLEMSIQSRENDSSCKALWPNAAVMGIGAQVAGGAVPVCLFDEHELNGHKQEASCSQLVANKMFRKKLPMSVNRVLDEINQIDAAGGAHPQSISNIIKTGHQVRFMLKKDDQFRNSIQNWLSPEWKKTIMDASIIAIIYCLENKVDLREATPEVTMRVKATFEHFISNCPFQDDQVFNKTVQSVKSNYCNQKTQFLEARLPLQSYRSQLLILGRVCSALHVCWGEKIAQIIMMHYWEIIYQGQAIFFEVKEQLSHLLKENRNQVSQSKYGMFQYELLKTNHIGLESTTPPSSVPELMVLYAEQTPCLILGNRPFMNVMNSTRSGFGLIFFVDNFNCTKSIFRGSSFPYQKWKELVDRISYAEPECWHVVKQIETGDYAPFIINGNRSHQYVPFSQLTFDSLIDVIREIDK